MHYKPSLLCIYPNMLDSTSYYRGFGPISKLHRIMDLNHFSVPEITWAGLSEADMVFLQRPFGKPFLKTANYSRLNRKPVWIDYDDALFIDAMPDYNPARENFDSPSAQADLTQILNAASIITVTTEKLRELMLKYNSNVRVIPNAWNDYLLPMEYKFTDNNRIAWRGSASHSGDLDAVKEELIKTINSRNDVQLTMIGENAESLLKHIRFSYRPQIELVKYFYFIRDLNPSIFLIPLQDNTFNRAKSCIAHLEATFAGAVSLAPDFPEFRKPGVVTYTSSKDFGEKLRAMIDRDIDLKSHYRDALAFVSSNLLLSQVNRERKELIESFLFQE